MRSGGSRPYVTLIEYSWSWAFCVYDDKHVYEENANVEFKDVSMMILEMMKIVAKGPKPWA